MLITLSDVRASMAKKFAGMHKGLLRGGNPFPITVKLAELTQAYFLENIEAIKPWAAEWNAWPGPGRVGFKTYSWSRIGAQVLPNTLEIRTADELAELGGHLPEWRECLARLQTLSGITKLAVRDLAQLYALALAYTPSDWTQFTRVITYLVQHDCSGLYLRQLPVEGVDTKWIGQHLADVTKVLRIVKCDDSGDAYSLTGLKKQPFRVRVRLLCPLLRNKMGGIGDLKVPIADLENWTIRPQRLVVTENLESGVALPDIPGAMAIMGLGNAVTELAQVEWLKCIPGVYWGDLDTYGLGIFARLSIALPRLSPILMDEATFLQHRDLWVPEVRQHPRPDNLPLEQAKVFDLLTLVGHPACNARLEQERLPWPSAMRALQAALEGQARC